MHVGARISDRLTHVGMSQSELARRVSLNQSTIAGLIRGKARSSAHLHRIARVLGTTPAYLAGETDDPDENAPPPPPEPRVQLVSLSVALPSERALAAAFQALLSVSRRMDEAALARELARRLPILLQAAANALPAPASDDDEDELETAAALDAALPPPREARRR